LVAEQSLGEQLLFRLERTVWMRLVESHQRAASLAGGWDNAVVVQVSHDEVRCCFQRFCVSHDAAYGDSSAKHRAHSKVRDVEGTEARDIGH
jgi:hypothetical protein